MVTYDGSVVGDKTAVSRGLTLTYRRTGTGEPTIFLHAVGASAAEWDLVIPLVESGLDVIALNMPGFGGSETPSRKFSVEDFADVVSGFLDALGLTSANLAGTHTGSMAAFHLAATEPAKVRKLALVDLPAWNAIEGQIVFERYFLPQHQARWAKEAEEDASGVGDGEQRQAERRFYRWVELCQQGNTSYDLDSHTGLVTTPTLIAYGDGSILRRREHRVHAGIRGSRLEIIADAPARAVTDQPQKVADLLLEFLA